MPKILDRLAIISVREIPEFNKFVRTRCNAKSRSPKLNQVFWPKKFSWSNTSNVSLDTPHPLEVSRRPDKP